jgi:hypothetical protein
MKRIFLFIVTNLAVMLTLSITAHLLGLNQFITKNGINSDITFIDEAKSEWYDFSNVTDCGVKKSESLKNTLNLIIEENLNVHMSKTLLPKIYDILPSMSIKKPPFSERLFFSFRSRSGHPGDGLASLGYGNPGHGDSVVELEDVPALLRLGMLHLVGDLSIPCGALARELLGGDRVLPVEVQDELGFVEPLGDLLDGGEHAAGGHERAALLDELGLGGHVGLGGLLGGDDGGVQMAIGLHDDLLLVTEATLPHTYNIKRVSQNV